MALITHMPMQLRDGSFFEVTLDDADPKLITVGTKDLTVLAVKAIEFHNAGNGRYEFDLSIDGVEKFTNRRFTIGQTRNLTSPTPRNIIGGTTVGNGTV